jgi:hypothetical protein
MMLEVSGRAASYVTAGHALRADRPNMSHCLTGIRGMNKSFRRRRLTIDPVTGAQTGHDTVLVEWSDGSPHAPRDHHRQTRPSPEGRWRSQRVGPRTNRNSCGHPSGQRHESMYERPMEIREASKLLARAELRFNVSSNKCQLVPT